MHLSGNIFDYFIVFWAGVLVSFTPCVYPVMPLTASFIAGANPRGSRWTGLWLSMVYVLGMAMVYCALAVAAMLSGKAFGQFQNQPLVYLAVANLLIVFALVMLDVIPLPNFGLTVPHPPDKRNFLTIFAAGLVSGVVVGPCTAPILGTLLLYVASKQNLWHGVSLLFVFSYGVGTSLILVGTFSSLLARLPKSGIWLLRVKQASGALLLLAAEYFLIQAGRLWA